jgi:vacuolar protein sorting-associated protein 16
VSEQVFRIGSTSPSAVLLDAIDNLEKNSAKADEAIRLIRPHISDAVDGCIKAAGYEWDSYWQKRLLKVHFPIFAFTNVLAASFGKAFLELYNSDEFVEMCKVLRVLNAVRDPKIGLPVTYAQYTKPPVRKLTQIPNTWWGGCRSKANESSRTFPRS